MPTQLPRLWQLSGRPCSRATIDDAIECAERRRRAHDDRAAVLVHGDVHDANALVTHQRHLQAHRPGRAAGRTGLRPRHHPPSESRRRGRPASQSRPAGPTHRRRRHSDLGVGNGATASSAVSTVAASDSNPSATSSSPMPIGSPKDDQPDPTHDSDVPDRRLGDTAAAGQDRPFVGSELRRAGSETGPSAGRCLRDRLAPRPTAVELRLVAPALFSGCRAGEQTTVPDAPCRVREG